LPNAIAVFFFEKAGQDSKQTFKRKKGI